MIDLKDRWEYITQVATYRLEHNQTTHHHVYCSDSELLGAAAEVGVRRYFGLSERLQLGLDQGVDILLNNKRVDIKATKWSRTMWFKYMQWQENKPIKCDLVLMCGVDTETMMVELFGYATRKDIQKAPINTTRQAACHEISIGILRPLWELTTMVHFKSDLKSLEAIPVL